MLSVGDTLTLAAHARAPRNPPGGVSKNVWAKHLRDVFMVSDPRHELLPRDPTLLYHRSTTDVLPGRKLTQRGIR